MYPWNLKQLNSLKNESRKKKIPNLRQTREKREVNKNSISRGVRTFQAQSNRIKHNKDQQIQLLTI